MGRGAAQLVLVRMVGKMKSPQPRLLSQYFLIKVGFSKTKNRYMGHEAEFEFQIDELTSYCEHVFKSKIPLHYLKFFLQQPPFTHAHA